MRILIADDDPVSLRLLESSLRKWKHEPVCAKDGDEALRLLTAEDAPTLALLDWMMPGLEGPEVVRKMREREAESADHGTKYLVLLTSRESHEDLLAGFASGADDYVTKPFHLDELRARLHVALRMLFPREGDHRMDVRVPLPQFMGPLKFRSGSSSDFSGLEVVTSLKSDVVR